MVPGVALVLLVGAAAALTTVHAQGATEGLGLLLRDSVLDVGDIAIKDIKVEFATVDVLVSALQCKDIGIGELSFEIVESSPTKKTVRAEIASVQLECTSPKLFSEAYTRGLKLADVEVPVGVSTSLSPIAVQVEFASADFARSPPTKATQTECSATISNLSLDVDAAMFDSTFFEGLPDTLASLLRPEVETLLCNLLGDLVASPFTNTLEDLEGYISRHQALANTFVDPMSKERDAAPPGEEEWFDFEASSVFDMAFSAFNSGFTTSKEQNLQPTQSQNNTASDYVRTFTNGTGVYEIAADGTELFGERSSSFGIALKLHSLRLAGLDTIVAFDPIEQFGKCSIGTNVSFGALSLEAVLGLDMWALGSKDSENGLKIMNETFKVGIELIDTDISLAFCLGIGVDTFWSRQFGPVLDDPIQCFMSAVKHFDASRVIAQFDGFSKTPVISGLVNPGFNALIEQIFDVLLDVYGPAGILALPGILIAEGPQLLNDGMKTFTRLNSDCPEPQRYADEPFFDFRSESYFKDIVELVREDVLPILNSDYVRDMTVDSSGIAGTYVLQSSKTMSSVDMGPIGTFTVGADQVHVSGLDSFHDIHFMETPGGPFLLHNAFKLGGALAAPVKQARGGRDLASLDPVNRTDLNVTGFDPLTLSMVLDFHFKGDTISFNNTFEFAFSFEAIGVAIDLIAKFDRYDFNTLELQQLVDLNCVLSRIDEADLAGFVVLIDHIKVSLRCLHCTSPAMPKMEALVQKQSVNDDFTSIVNGWIDSIRNRFRDKLNHDQLQTTIEEARRKCQGTFSESSFAEFTPSLESDLNVFAIVGGIVLAMFMGLIVGCLLKLHRPRLGRKKLDALGPIARKGSTDSTTSTASQPSDSWSHRFFRFNSASSDTADIVIAHERFGSVDSSMTMEDEQQQTEARTTQEGSTGYSEEDRELQEEFRSSPLVLHPMTPIPIRFCVVMVLLTNIFLFVIGHIMVAASINLKFEVLGDEIPLNGFESFSITKSIKQIWDAGIYPLAILIGGLSGAWPYIKVLTMLHCWVSPPSMLSPARRGRWLMTLDSLGKWSMIDVYVLLLCMVAFGLKIENPRMDILPPGFYGIYVTVDPGVGLVSFTAAAMLSLIANNVCVNYHRNAVAADEQLRDQLLAEAADRPRLGMRQQVERLQDQGHNFDDEDDECNNDDVDEYEDDIAQRNSTTHRRGRRRRFSTWLDAGTEDISSRQRGKAEEREALRTHVYRLSSGDSVRFTLRGQQSIVGILLVTFVIAVVGGSIPCFGFKILGVVGMFMDVDELRSWMPYSVIDLFVFAMDQAFASDNESAGYLVGVIYLAASFLLTVFVMPLVQLLGLLVLWTVPFTLQRQKWFFFLAEIFGAWATIDVFIVSLIIAVLEMGAISASLLGGVCTNILPMINGVLVPSGFVQEENATCLYVASSLEPGCALLLATAFLTNATSQFMLRSAHVALDEREHDIKHSLEQYDTTRRTEVKTDAVSGTLQHSSRPSGFLRLLRRGAFALGMLEVVTDLQRVHPSRRRDDGNGEAMVAAVHHHHYLERI